jgi:RNA polymerase primary sigma factor
MSNEEIVKLIQSGINTTDNMEILYMQNEGFIVSVAKHFSYICHIEHRHKRVNNNKQVDRKGPVSVIEFEELMNEAYFGLYEAVNRYDANQGVLFLTYAAHWIRQAVKRYLENSGQVIRVPVHMQQKIYQYNKVSGYFLREHGRIPTVNEFADYLGLTAKEVISLESFMFQKNVQSLDTPLTGLEDEELSIGDSVPGEGNTEQEVIEKLSSEELHTELWDIVDTVLKNETMQEVVRLRFIGSLTLAQTGERLRISPETVKNLENKAIKRLRRNSRTKHLMEDYLLN